MPRSFSDARAEHVATRRAAGLFDFSFMGLYEFSGVTALDRIQTRRTADLEPGQLVYTLLLNEDGSVFNDATLWRLEGGRYWLFTGRRSDFKRFREVARDRSGEFSILALQGPASGAILAQLLGAQAVRELRYFRFLERASLHVARLGYSGELGYELMVPGADGPSLRRTLLDAGAGHGIVECGSAAADSLRIEAGYVLFGREIDGRANPRELGLERLVSGKRDLPLARKLVGLEILEGTSRRDLPLAAMTSECRSPTLEKLIALGFAPPDASGHVRLTDGRLARVAGLPFYDPERRRPRAAPL